MLAAQADPATLLDGLRAMGYAPAAESAEGDVLITRAHAHRTPPRTAPEPGPGRPAGARRHAARRGGPGDPRGRPRLHGRAQAAAPEPRPPRTASLPRTTSAETLATMQAAVLTGAALWIGYVNAEGAASQRVIAPVRVEGGFVTAYDHTADEVRTYPLHRITGVAELADELSRACGAPAPDGAPDRRDGLHGPRHVLACAPCGPAPDGSTSGPGYDVAAQ